MSVFLCEPSILSTEAQKRLKTALRSTETSLQSKSELTAAGAGLADQGEPWLIFPGQNSRLTFTLADGKIISDNKKAAQKVEALNR